MKLILFSASFALLSACYTPHEKIPGVQWEHLSYKKVHDRMENGSWDDEPVIPLAPGSKPCVSSELEEIGCN